MRPAGRADYVVVGMGAGGSVVAARLAEAGRSVIILEAGPNNLPEVLGPTEGKFIAVPALDALLFKNPLGPNPSPSDLFYRTNRHYAYIRGTGAGGSTNHHGLVDGRGDPVYYNRIAKLTGDERWSYPHLEPLFRKMETYNVPHANPKKHGHHGWLQVRNPHKEPNWTHKLSRTAQETLHLPFRPDLQGDPDQVIGVGPAHIQVRPDGTRSYAAQDLLWPLRSRVQMEFNTLASRIILDGTTARGIVARVGRRLNIVDDAHEDGTPYETVIFLADKEVIVCAGAIETPKLLMLSGIGPRKVLKAFDIPVIVRNKHIGRHLMDHLEVGLVHQLHPEKIMWRYQATLALQALGSQPSPFRPLLERFQDPTSLAEPGFDLVFDIAHETKHANIHILSALFAFQSFDLTHAKDLLRSQFDPTYARFPEVYHTFIMDNLQITSGRGRIRLASADPTYPPQIILALEKDATAVRNCADGIEMMRRVMAQPAMAQYVIREVLPGPGVDVEAYIRNRSAFGHHMSGTCGMTYVVDSSLRVKGCHKLRLCDLSVLPFPHLVGANPSRATYIIGELLSTFLLA